MIDFLYMWNFQIFFSFFMTMYIKNGRSRNANFRYLLYHHIVILSYWIFTSYPTLYIGSIIIPYNLDTNLLSFSIFFRPLFCRYWLYQQIHKSPQMKCLICWCFLFQNLVILETTLTGPEVERVPSRRITHTHSTILPWLGPFLQPVFYPM